MTAQPGLGVTGNGVGVTTPIAHRLAQSGLVAKAGGTRNLIRPGLFYDGASTIVSGTAGMSYDVAAFTAALTRGAGQGTVLLANDGTVNVATTAAPGSNSRIDIVYVWQRDFAIDGTDSNPVIGVVQGTPSATPSAPSLAAFPGALELARITVPAGVTATNTGTTITQTAQYTAAANAPIPVRTSANLPASASSNQLAQAIDTGVIYQWNGSTWAATPAGVAPAAFLTRNTAQSIANLTTTTVTWDTITSTGGGWSQSAGVITIPATGVYSFTFSGMWIANGSATGTTRRLFVTRNGTTERIFDNHITAVGATAEHAMGLTGMWALTAGDTIRFQVLHNGGVALNLGALTNGELSCRIQLVGQA